MRRFYPYGRYQGGGQAIMDRYHPHAPVVPIPVLPVVTDPREFMRMYGERSRGDLPVHFRLPTRSQVEGQIKQGEVAKEQLKKKLERVGYKGAHARAMVNKGKSKLPENVQQQLENLEASDYRVQHHPDYDPSRPVEDQQDLNYDNSFRTTVLRGANMFTDSGDPVVDFMAGAVSMPGRSFANLTMDAENRYVKPGLVGGVGNFGLDVMGVVPAEAAAGYVTQRAIPAARNMVGQAYKVNPWAKGNVFNRWDADNYFRIVDEAAYKDALESGVIRSNPTGDAKGAMEALSIKLGRPTAFPSFAKGVPDVTYLPKEGNGYIIESAMPMFRRGDVNPVTGNVIKGRHWAYRPINMTTGETMESIPLNQVNIYRPHWLKGYEVADDAAAGSGVMNELVGRGLPEASAAMERQLVRSWRPPMGNMNEVADDVAFFDKYALGPAGDKLVEKGEADLLDNLDKGTLKELKDLFAKSMRGGEAEAYLDDLFSNPEELRKFLSQLPRGMDKAFLKDKLQKLPLDELKNYFKGRKLDVGSPNEGGAPWNFGTTSSNRIRGPYSSEAMKKDPWIRDMFGGNADEVEQKKELFDYLLNPVTHQRMGGVVPAMPMIGIRRGMI